MPMPMPGHDSQIAMQAAHSAQMMMAQMMGMMQQNAHHSQMLQQNMQQQQLMLYQQLMQPTLQKEQLNNQHQMVQNTIMQSMMMQNMVAMRNATPPPSHFAKPPMPMPNMNKMPISYEPGKPMGMKIEGDPEPIAKGPVTIEEEQAPETTKANANITTPTGKEISSKPFDTLNKHFKETHKDLYREQEKHQTGPVVFLEPKREPSKIENRLGEFFGIKVIKYEEGEWEELRSKIS